MADSEARVGLYAQFKNEPELEKKGIELVYKTGETNAAGNALDTVLLIARAGGGNTKFQKILDFKTKPYRRQIQTETILPAQLEGIYREVYAESVVLGWWTVERDKSDKEVGRVATIKDATGVDMVCVRENIIKLFTELPDLFADVQQQAQKVVLFRRDQLDAAAGNS